jgi:hypothetical protein
VWAVIFRALQQGSPPPPYVHTSGAASSQPGVSIPSRDHCTRNCWYSSGTVRSRCCSGSVLVGSALTPMCSLAGMGDVELTAHCRQAAVTTLFSSQPRSVSRFGHPPTSIPLPPWLVIPLPGRAPRRAPPAAAARSGIDGICLPNESSSESSSDEAYPEVRSGRYRDGTASTLNCAFTRGREMALHSPDCRTASNITQPR